MYKEMLNIIWKHSWCSIYGSWVMVFYTTSISISVISWRSALLVEDTGAAEENLTLKSLTNFVTSFCIKYTSPWVGFELTTLMVIDTDYTGSCKSTYHTIMTTATTIFSCTMVKVCELMYTQKNELSNFK
jgi:hypothetical protein